MPSTRAILAAVLLGLVALSFATPVAYNDPICMPHTVTIISTVTAALFTSSSMYSLDNWSSTSPTLARSYQHSSTHSLSHFSSATTKSEEHRSGTHKAPGSYTTTFSILMSLSSTHKSSHHSYQNTKPAWIPSITSETTSILSSTTTTHPFDRQLDNCLRHFIRHPDAAEFCATYTTVSHTAITGIPAFVSQCHYQRLAISSACTCITTGIPSSAFSVIGSIHPPPNTPINSPTAEHTRVNQTHPRHTSSSSVGVSLNCSANLIYSTVTLYPSTILTHLAFRSTSSTPHTTSTSPTNLSSSSSLSSDTTTTQTTTSKAMITTTPFYGYYGW
jgi:hypothetical protein